MSHKKRKSDRSRYSESEQRKWLRRVRRKLLAAWQFADDLTAHDTDREYDRLTSRLEREQ